MGFIVQFVVTAIAFRILQSYEEFRMVTQWGLFLMRGTQHSFSDLRIAILRGRLVCCLVEQARFFILFPFFVGCSEVILIQVMRNHRVKP